MNQFGWFLGNSSNIPDQTSNNLSTSGIRENTVEQQKFNSSGSNESHDSFEIVDNEQILDEMEDVVDNCADKMSEICLQELEPITVFVKATNKFNVDIFFEITTLTKFDLVSHLNEKALEHLEFEGFGTYEIQEITDLSTNERLSVDDPLIDKHVYHLIVGPQLGKPSQREIKIKIGIDNEKPHVFVVPFARSIIEIIHEQVMDAEQVASIKKLSDFYSHFVLCKKTYRVKHRNEHFQIVTKTEKKLDAYLLDNAVQALAFDLYRTHAGQLSIIRDIRSFLCKKDIDIKVKIDNVLNANVLPFVSECVKSKNVEVQHEATWALINLSAGTNHQTQLISGNKILQPLFRLIDSHDANVAENAVWALSNLAHENHKTCAELLKLKLHKNLQTRITDELQTMSHSFLFNILELIQVVCDGVGSRWACAAKQCVQRIFQIMKHPSPPVVVKALQVLSSLTADPSFVVGATTSKDPASLILSLLNSPEEEVQVETVKLLGNIMAGTSDQVQVYLNMDILSKLLNKMDDERFRTFIIRCLSNIAAGSAAQVMDVVESGLVQKVIPYLCDIYGAKIHEEIAWLIENLVHCSGSDYAHLSDIITADIFPEIQRRLSANDFTGADVRSRLEQSINDFEQKCSEVNKQLHQQFLLALDAVKMEKYKMRLNNLIAAKTE